MQSKSKKIKDTIYKISNFVTKLSGSFGDGFKSSLDSSRYKAVDRSRWDSVRDHPTVFPPPYLEYYNITPKILLPNLKLDSSFTTEMWLNINYDIGNLPHTVDYQVPVLQFGDDSVSQFILALSLINERDPSALAFIGIFSKDTIYHYAGDIYYNIPLHNLRKNVPFHIALSYKNNTMDVYLNGELFISKKIYLQNLQNLTNNSMFFLKNLKQQQPGYFYRHLIASDYYIPNNLRFDYTYNLLELNFYNFDYRVKDFRIWNYARTNEQIKNNYNKPILPGEYGLYYYLPFDTVAYLAPNGIGSMQLPNAATGVTALKTNSNAELNDPISKSIGWFADKDTFFKYYPNEGLGKNFKLQGSYSDSLLYGEILQYSLNDGQTWINIDSAKDNVWFCYITDSNITSNNVQVRSIYNGFVLKTFNPFPIRLVPLAPAITNKASYKNNISINFNPPILNYNGGGASYKLYLDTIPIYSAANLNNKIETKPSYIPTKNAQVFNTATSPIAIGNLSYNKKYYVRVASYNQKGSLIDSNNIYINNYDPDYISLFGTKDTSSFTLIYPTYKVKTSVKNGTITSTSTVFLDSNIRITYSPTVGYLLDSIYINQLYNATTTMDSTNGYTFNKVQDTQYIQVVYKKILDTVFMVSGANGQLIPNKAGGFARYGDSVYIAIVPNIGYLIDSVLVNGVKQNGLRPVGDTIKFYPITANHR